MNMKGNRRARLALVLTVIGASTAVMALPSDADSETVRRAEYVKAVDATVRCVEAAGIDVVERTSGPDGALGFTMSYAEEAAQEADAAYSNCYESNLADIEARWLDQNAPTQADLAKRRETIGGCIRRHDSTFPARPTADEIIDRMRAGRIPKDCHAQIEQAGSF